MMPGHAERPDRLRAIHRHLSASGLLAELDVREARPVEDATLAVVNVLKSFADLHLIFFMI